MFMFLLKLFFFFGIIVDEVKLLIF